MKKPLVKDYMTRDVVALHPDLTVREAIDRVIHEGHVGLPVAEGDQRWFSVCCRGRGGATWTIFTPGWSLVEKS